MDWGDAGQAGGDPDGWSGKWSVLIILNLKKENISNHGLCSNVLSYYPTKFCFTRQNYFFSFLHEYINGHIIAHCDMQRW